MLTARLEDATGYGRIIRDLRGNITSIVEHKDANQEQLRIKEINSGMYYFDAQLLVQALDRLDNNNAQGEYYITDVISILNTMGCAIGGYILENSEEIMGLIPGYN